MNKEITDNFRERIKQIYKEENNKKRKTIFIDNKEPSIHFPWKKLTKEYKLKLITEYIEKNHIDFNINDISNYKLANIEYEKGIETIHHIDFIKKE